MQKKQGATVLISIGIAFIIVSIGFFLWEISLIANITTYSMQIYNFELDAWETWTFSSATTPTPIWGTLILITGMFPLVIGFMWKVKDSEFNFLQFLK